MKDKELKLNASGYRDELCYQTIKNVDVPKPGEIWTHGAYGYYMLIMANVNGICSILRLSDQEKEGSIAVTCKTPMYTNPVMLGYCFQQSMGEFVKCIKHEEFIAVKDAVTKALDLEKLPLSTESGVNEEYVVRLKDNISALEAKVMVLTEENERLFKEANAAEEKAKALEEQRDKLLEEIAGYGETIKNQAFDLQVKEKNNVFLGEKLNEVAREADKAEIYKEMYMTLLDKVISVRGCANE